MGKQNNWGATTATDIHSPCKQDDGEAFFLEKIFLKSYTTAQELERRAKKMGFDFFFLLYMG